MDDPSQLTEFGKVFIYLLMGIFFVLFSLFLSRQLALKRPNPLKLSTYECGEEITGSSWIQFSTRFYVVALIFLLFDVELVFIFPWSTVFGNESILAIDSRWGWLSLGEMFVFIGILLTGLLYIWKKGDLSWIKPLNILPSAPEIVPFSLYSRINEEKYTIREFSLDMVPESNTEQIQTPAPNTTKLAFSPRFKRPLK